MKIGYARVSTADQNLDLQTDALKAAGAEKIYKDRASGSNADRIGLNDMLGHLRSGDVVIVWRLDRLARSLKDLIDTAAALEAAGVQLVSLQESIDTTTTAGKLFFQIFGALAEFERNLIIERTQAGLAAARARGIHGGRKPALSLSKFNQAKKLIAAGSTFDEIARALSTSTRTIRRIVNGEYDRHFVKAEVGRRKAEVKRKAAKGNR